MERLAVALPAAVRLSDVLSRSYAPLELIKA
jgi:hypothetical protein